MPARRVALGLAPHTGWAALIAVAGSGAAPEVLDRARLELTDGTDQAHRFVYHAAQDLEPAAAARWVREQTTRARRHARAAVSRAVDRLAAQGCTVTACGIIVGERPLEASLPEILQSHALLHTAEGELFRAALRAACEALGIDVTAVRARELPARGAAILGVAPARLTDRLAALGRAAGRPWAKDQKDALIAALVAAAA